MMTDIQKVSIDGLNISVVPADSGLHTKKGKGKASTPALEILSGAELKLKGGVHYGLLGRNGTGKSSEQFRSRLPILCCILSL